MENQKTITMEFKGTKGEWEFKIDNSRIRFNNPNMDLWFKDEDNFFENEPSEVLANARLISAAPDLLKALKSIIDPLTGLVYDNVAKCIGSEQAEAIENAIQKALS